MKGFFDLDNEDKKKKIQKKKEHKIVGCETCKMYQHCNFGKIEMEGKGKKRIMVVFDMPTRREDKRKKAFDGDEYYFMEYLLAEIGIDMYEDCFITHAVQCYQGKNINPMAIQGCHYRLMDRISETKPEKIIITGEVAMKTLYHGRESGRFGFSSYDTKFPGYVIPDQEIGINVIPIQDLKETIDKLVFRKKQLIEFDKYEDFGGFLWDDPQLNKNDKYKLRLLFTRNQLTAVTRDIVFYEHNYLKSAEYIDNVETAMQILRHLLKQPSIAYDTETTGLKPHAEGHEIVVWGFSDGQFSWGFPNFNNERFQRLLKRLLTDPKIKKYGANIKYEHNWIRELNGYEVQGWDFDTVLASHLIDNRSGTTSLKFQSFVRLGVVGYDDALDPFIKSVGKSGNSFNRMKEAPIDETCIYCANDAMLTFGLTNIMQPKIKHDRVLSKGYALFHKGVLALSDIEHGGILVDEARLMQNEMELEKELLRIADEIQELEEVKAWHKANKGEFNFLSNQQLGELLYDVMGNKVTKTTPKGAPSTDKEALEDLGTPLCQKVLEYKSMQKLKDTFLAGIKREVVNGVIHPGFSLNLVISYRSSSQWPNFQNLPSHNPFATKMIMSTLMPSPGNQIVGVDMKSLEVGVGCMYHKDPKMISYLEDLSTDMHRDLASRLFMCPPEEVTKDMRYIGKNGMSFPIQYGDYYKSIGEAIWNKHLTKDHKKYFADRGIKTMEAFIEHVRTVEDWYWNEQYAEFGKWKIENWNQYVNDGYLNSKTGFRYSNIMTRNELNNYPIQGSGFHLVLQALVWINDWLKENGYKTRIISQVHDAIYFDTPPAEWEEIKNDIAYFMTKKLNKRYPWTKVAPLRAEADYYVNNWYEHEEIDGKHRSEELIAY